VAASIQPFQQRIRLPIASPEKDQKSEFELRALPNVYCFHILKKKQNVSWRLEETKYSQKLVLIKNKTGQRRQRKNRGWLSKLMVAVTT
jgi:hypothetical protein